MRFYAYCLSDELNEAALERCISQGLVGIDGARPRLVDYGGVAAVVSPFAEARIAASTEHVKAHNRIVGAVLTKTTPLPFRFGTLASPERLEKYVESHRGALAASLARVRGCVEMSVKIIWEVDEMRRESEAQQSQVGEAAWPAEEQGRGTAYLSAKRRALSGSEALRAKAEEITVWLASTLGEAVREAHVNVRPEETLVVRAAHLVERARLEDYRQRLEAARAERGAWLHFLTSGAWPPYSFSEVSS